MTASQVDAIVRTLSLLLAAYEPEMEPLDLDALDTHSYRIGFREGARSAYMDAILRIREMKDEPSAVVTRIGGGAA